MVLRLLLGLGRFVKGVVVAVVLFVVYTVRFVLPDCCKCKKTIKGRVCLITGAGRGIGRHLAVELAREKATVVLWDVDDAFHKETEVLMRRATGKLDHVYSYKCDVSDRAQVFRIAAKVQREVGPVEVLINNAGIVHGKTLLDLSQDEIEQTIKTNLLAHYWTIQAFLPSMMEQNRGHIVAIASVAGVVGTTHLSDYCASKFGIRGLMESLDVELTHARSNVQLTTVCPYYVSTGLFQGIRTRFKCFLPILTPEYVAKRTVAAILTNQEILYLPRAIYFLLGVKGFTPYGVMRHLGFLFGAHNAMKTFTGRIHQMQASPTVAVTITED